MMLLTIDVGNTQIVLGMFDEDELIGHWRVATEPHATYDEVRWKMLGILGADGFTPSDVRGVAVSSVVPSITTALRSIASHITTGEIVVVGPGTKTGMAIEIDNPREVGADRVVNAVAARERYGRPAIVIDFGTSTNFDVVGPAGSYLGGSIAPGLEVSTEALVMRTAALRRVEYTPPRSVIGKGTVEAIQSGALFGHAGLVDGIVSRIESELDGDATKIATGGLASTIVPHCRTVDVIDRYLTLEGLRLIYDLNRERHDG